MGQPIRQDKRVSRADVNRARKLLAHRGLDRLLAEATHPSYTGEVSVTLTVRDGRLGTPKLGSMRFATED